MREIKFRAWDKLFLLMRSDGFSVSANGDPVGYFIEPDVTPNTTRICGEWRGDSTIILMQFTGLRDKNGKEIYEGDIVQLGEDRGVFNWAEDETGWGIFEKGLDYLAVGVFYGHDGEHRKSWDNLEVIGNIYESPPLY